MSRSRYRNHDPRSAPGLKQSAQAGAPAFLSRLRQRKLVQWALAYVAFAFALLQGVDIIAQQFEWPEVLQRGITLALALGFFVTLLLAWYHGERGEQHVRGSELLLLALLLAVGGGLLWRYARTPAAMPPDVAVVDAARAPEAGHAAASRRAADVPGESIAVLPMAYEGNDPDDRLFADGLSEDLITELSQYGGLKVIGRTSAFQFRGSGEDSASIGRKLGVARLLEGSVRRVGREVRISAMLVEGGEGRMMWWERDVRAVKDRLGLQDDITRAVVSVLRVRLAGEPGAVLQSERPPGGDPDAWQAYLEGQRLFGDAGRYGQAMARFDKAIGIDPDYAVAYAWKARTKIAYAAYALTGDAARRVFAEAGEAVDKALELDPDLAIAHQVRAYLYSVRDFDWSVADAELRRTIQLAPYDGGGKVYYGQLQGVLGHMDKAVALTREGLASDPRNIRYRVQLLWNLIDAGRLEEAERELRTIAEMSPGFQSGEARAAIALQRGDARAALAAARENRDADGEAGAAEVLALQIGSDREAADAALARLVSARQSRGIPYVIAEAFALRGDPDRMFAWLERAWADRDPAINRMLADPILARYRGDPRFAALCKARGVPVPAHAGPVRGFR
jgi:serine/threonine-protein kinase